MSFILDALKRSERARKVLGAAQPPPPGESGESPPRRGWFVGLALLLLANAALLAWFMLRPTAEPLPAAARPVAGEVRSLEREAGGERAVTGAPTAVVPTAAAPAAPIADAVALADLDPALRARVAAFHIDVHGWADAPAERFAVINLKRRAIGDALGDGATLADIVVDGVVIEIDGRRVLLPRQ